MDASYSSKSVRLRLSEKDCGLSVHWARVRKSQSWQMNQIRYASGAGLVNQTDTAGRRHFGHSRSSSRPTAASFNKCKCDDTRSSTRGTGEFLGCSILKDDCSAEGRQEVIVEKSRYHKQSDWRVPQVIWIRRALVFLPLAIAAVLTVLVMLADRLPLRPERIAGYCFLFGTPWAWLLDRGWLARGHSRWVESLMVYAVVLWIPALLYSVVLWPLVRALGIWRRGRQLLRNRVFTN